MGKALRRDSRHAMALATPFTKIAAAIAKNHGVRVVPSNAACCTDGTVIHVPFAAEVAQGATLQTLNGMLDHELGHVRVEEECKRAGIPGFVERLRMASSRGDRELAALMNIVEDVRIENDLGREYPGMKENLAKLNERMMRLRREDVVKGRHENLWREITCGFIARARGFDHSWMTPKATDYLDRCDDLVERARKLGGGVSGMLKGIELAGDFKERLHEIADERREAEKERRKAEREREVGEEKCDSGDEPGEGEDDEDVDPSRVDHAGELGDKSEELEDGDDEGGKDEGDDDSPGIMSGDDSSTPSDEPEDDDDEPEDESKGGSGDSEEDTEDGKAGAGSDDAEDDDTEGSSDSAKSTAGKGDGEDDDADDSAKSDDDADGGDEPEDEDDDEGEEIAGDLDEGPDFEDLRDEMRKALDDDLIKDAWERGIVLPHPIVAELDKWRPGEQGDYLSDPYGAVKAEVRGQIGALRQKQIARIQTRARARLHVGLDDGDLDQSRLHEVAVGARDVYSEVRPGRQVNVAIQVLLDLSGSIGAWRGGKGSCEHFMRRTLVALAESWEPIRGMAYDILGFHNFFPGSFSMPRELHGLRMGLQPDGVHYVRMPFEMIHFKQYHEGIAAFRSRFAEVGPHHDNCDHEAVWMAAKRLASRPEKRKILCVINDGAPASHGVPYHVAESGLRQNIRTITKAGIEVWGIGAGTDAPKRYYNESTGAKNVCINDLETMASTLLQLFSKRIEAA